MRKIGYPDTDHMVVLPHTPREDALARGYEGWLREVDNPFFNEAPGVVHYANWRVRAPTPAVPFTHVDFMRLASLEAAAELATNPDVIEFGNNWNQMWGRYPDAKPEDAHLNGHLYLCHRLAGRRPITRHVALQTSSEELTGGSEDAELWEITMPIVGDARFAYLRVVPLSDPVEFSLIDRGLTGAALGSALAELIAAPNDGSTERTRQDAAELLVP